MTPLTQPQPPLTTSTLTLQDKLRTQTFRKGATHKLKPSPSDITAIGLSNSVVSPWDHHLTMVIHLGIHIFLISGILPLEGWQMDSRWVHLHWVKSDNGLNYTKIFAIRPSLGKNKNNSAWPIVRALARPNLFPFLSPFSLYGLSYCMPKLTSLISYCALS